MFQMLVVGVVALLGGVGLTSWILRERIRRDEREIMRVDGHFFTHLNIEQEFWAESTGYILKEKWVVLRERLMYKQFPLSAWLERRLKVDNNVDSVAIERLAASLTQLVSEAKTLTIRHIIHQLPERGAIVEAPALNRAGHSS